MKNLLLSWYLILIPIFSLAQNSIIIKDIFEGSPGSLTDAFNPHLELNGNLIFAANDGIRGLELWISDGTEEGTVLLKEIRPQQIGPNFGSDIRSMRRVGDYILFHANDGEHGAELWRTDGTEEGTILLKDINPDASSYSNDSRSVRVIDDIYYFVANSSDTGIGELWRSDGTEEGTYLLADPLTGVSASSDILTSLIEFNGELYFYARDNGLWKSDGTQAGTIQTIAEEDLPFAFTNIYRGENYLYSSNITDGVHKTYRTDGTIEETVQILEVETTLSSFEIPRIFLSHAGHVWFIANESLYKTDNTATGTQLVELTNELEDFLYQQSFNNIFTFNGDLFFYMKKDETGAQERGLFKKVGDNLIYISRTPNTSNGVFTYIPTEDGRFFFNARIEGLGEELVSTTGQVDNLTIHENTQNNLFARIERFTLVGNTLFFDAIGNGFGRELNKLDFEPFVQLSVSTTQTNISCFGGNNAEITVESTSGTPPFSIEWNNGISGFNPQNLSSGSYSFTITDSEDVSFSQTITITEPDALEINIAELTNIDCNGNINGQISTEISGGTQDYTLAWNEGSDTETITNLSVGEYSLSVTDANGCTTTESFVITEPEILEIIDSEITNVNCNGEATGQISTEISGGTQDYTFDWSGGNGTEIIISLEAGEYSLNLTDANGCTVTESFTITEPEVLEITNSEITNIDCNGEATGQISTEVSGGVQNYIFEWSEGSDTEEITNLEAGEYSLSITDANGCITTEDFIVSEPSEIQAELTTTDANADSNDGTAEISVEGGISPYSFQWSHSDAETTNTVMGLSPDDYSVTITDANNCETIVDFTIDNISSLFEQEEKEYFSIYPNPTSETFQIKISSETSSSSDMIYIYNSLGQLEHSTKINQATYSYQLSTGVYTVTLKKDKKNYSQRVVVIR